MSSYQPWTNKWRKRDPSHAYVLDHKDYKNYKLPSIFCAQFQRACIVSSRPPFGHRLGPLAMGAFLHSKGTAAWGLSWSQFSQPNITTTCTQTQQNNTRLGIELITMLVTLLSYNYTSLFLTFTFSDEIMSQLTTSIKFFTK